jgi:tRNA wybutosine-synthesizing protein 4
MFPAVAFLNYEMITPEDKFGQQMVENIEMRGCSLLGIHECPSLEAQKARMLSVLGGEGTQAEAITMGKVYKERLEADRARIEKLEMFDEWEEWDLLQAHYCLVLGIRNTEQYSFEGVRI